MDSQLIKFLKMKRIYINESVNLNTGSIARLGRNCIGNLTTLSRQSLIPLPFDGRQIHILEIPVSQHRDLWFISSDVTTDGSQGR